MRLRLLPSLLLAAALSVTACSKAEPPAPPPPAVSVATPISREVVDWDEFVGQFEAAQRAEVRARVGGYVQQVHFRDGQHVRRGQLLFTLDPRPAQAQLAAARAQQTQAQATMDLASAEFERARTLLEAQAVSQEEFETRRAAVQQAKASLASAEAAVRARALDVEFTRVTAPLSGRASDRRVDAGNLVAGGSSAGDVLTTIVSTDPIHFRFDASEAVMLKYLRETQAGRAAPIRVRLQDEADYRWNGALEFTDNAVDTSSGTVRLRASIRNPGGFLRPGLFGHARLAGGAPYRALLIPDAAVVTDGPRKVVYVVDAKGVVAAKAVQLGPLVDNLRVVRGGLSGSDRVVVSGVQRARPGATVTVRTVAVSQTAAKPSAPLTAAPPASTATTTGVVAVAR